MSIDESVRAHGRLGGAATALTHGAFLVRLAARVHLLWVLIEDTLRQEVNFSPAVVGRWRDNLCGLSDTIEPLELGVLGDARVRATRGGDELRYAVRYFEQSLRGAIGFLGEPERPPVGRIYGALGEVRNARLALRVLARGLARADGLNDPVAPRLAAQTFTRRGDEQALREAYESALAVRSAADASAQCQASRQLYLAVYRAMAFDERAARAFHRPALDVHAELVERMPPSVPRECVRVRLEVLRQIPPERFEPTALRLVASSQRSPEPAPA